MYNLLGYKLCAICLCVLCVGLTYGQVHDLSCGPFCLSSQTVCTCTVTWTVLSWEVIRGDDSPGLANLRSVNLNVPVPLSGTTPFEALLTSNTSETLTATLTFTTLSEYQGYVIRCDRGGIFTSLTINIPGINW